MAVISDKKKYKQANNINTRSTSIKEIKQCFLTKKEVCQVFVRNGQRSLATNISNTTKALNALELATNTTKALNALELSPRI